ncbi:hypothetical protein [Tropicimonas sp. IMCC34043]|uniref:hypothetical protein n=1 Tax=Tropicimonas sp. IMCC34043 TaxID=2248760 RepID=UPI000E24FA13|nr:hypothetical protein [Tropicimonas sp. IMCC34043]
MLTTASKVDSGDVLAAIRRLVATDRRMPGGREVRAAPPEDAIAALSDDETLWQADAADEVRAVRDEAAREAPEADPLNPLKTAAEAGAAAEAVAPAPVAGATEATTGPETAGAEAPGPTVEDDVTETDPESQNNPPPFLRSFSRRGDGADLLVLKEDVRVASPEGEVPETSPDSARDHIERDAMEQGEPRVEDAEGASLRRPRHQGGNAPRAGFVFGAVAAENTAAAGTGSRGEAEPKAPASAPVDDRTVPGQHSLPGSDEVLVLGAGGASADAILSGTQNRLSPAGVQGQAVVEPATRPDAPQLPPGLDDAQLRALIVAALDAELKGPLGEKITREIRRLVRREIGLALAAQRLDRFERTGGGSDEPFATGTEPVK